MADSTLRSKGALVTGGSRGIGRAVVRRLAADEAAVAFSYVRDGQAASALVAEVEAHGGRCAAFRRDSGVAENVPRLFDEAQAFLEHQADDRALDIVINNAGVSSSDGSPEGGGALLGVSKETFDRIMAVNVLGTVLALQECARRMADGGAIVNISSLNTVVPVPEYAVYSASKAAVEQLAIVGAKELGGRGITVNAIAPGATNTEMLRKEPDENLELYKAMSPLGRLGTPEDIANVVAFLVGGQGRWMTGQVLVASGGLSWP